MLKGGHEAPTKPKGRPKKNSIPTTEEIEAQERLAAMLVDEDRLRQTQTEVGAHTQAHAQAQGHLYQSQPQDLSTGSGVAESHSPPVAQAPATREQQQLLPLSSPKTHTAS